MSTFIEPISDEHFIQDDELREIYEARHKWQLDHNTAIKVAKIEKLHDVLIRQMSRKFSLSKQEEEHIKLVNTIDKLDKAIDEIIVADSKEAVLKYLK